MKYSKIQPPETAEMQADTHARLMLEGKPISAGDSVIARFPDGWDTITIEMRWTDKSPECWYIAAPKKRHGCELIGLTAKWGEEREDTRMKKKTGKPVSVMDTFMSAATEQKETETQQAKQEAPAAADTYPIEPWRRETRSVHQQLLITPYVKQALKEKAKQEGVSINEIAARAFEAYLFENKE